MLHLIGNIDDDAYPEIMFITGYTAADQTNANDRIRAFKYEPGNSVLTNGWTFPHTDKSGFTGLTLFDFNQDQKMELVYRDETLLRIINASGIHHITGVENTPPYNLAEIACTSATRAEIPVIADIDDDGYAEIITIGPKTGTFAYSGPLRIFKGPASSPWAPARKVWNQYAYNAVNVNEDLTIPKHPLNPATVFPGDDGVFGTIDDVRPYNNFLQQQTKLNKEGTPIWLTPKGEIIGIPTFIYNGVTDEMNVTIQVKNTGDASFTNPFWVTVYKNAVGDATNFSYEHQSFIGVDETATITFKIPNYQANWGLGSTTVIKINDSGDGQEDQQVCEPSPEYNYPGSGFPDNIIDAECYIEPESTIWSFKEITRSTQAVSALGNPLAGDVDNDGKIEIVTAGTTSNGYLAAGLLYIFDDQLAVKYTINLNSGLNLISNAYSMADVDGDGYAEIYVCAVDGYLYKYSHNKQAYNGSNYSFEKKVQHATSQQYYYCQPMIADFNGDGFPEIVVLDKIFDANTLDLLVDGNVKGTGDLGYGAGHAATNTSSSNSLTSIMAIGDIDGDGFPELLAGSTAYKITIASRTNPSLNSFTAYKQADTTGRSEIGDGATAIADMDLDGMLDVVVSRRVGTNGVAIYIWNPRTGEIINQNIVNNLYVYPKNGVYGPFGPSLPFIGDIDGDGKPEVVVISHSNGTTSGGGMVTAYDFESGQLTKKTTGNWPLTTTDYSAATAITLFDFNQDKQSELVYRDCNHLRIIDGATATDLVTPLVACGSATGQEYAIVVDYNNDGSAEIVVTGHPTSTSDNATNGYLRAFGSDGTQWAPARKVWNQYAYNAVNINEDLTVPRVQFNPATRFPGDNGTLGDGDDVRPFNGYLQQQTFISKNGLPLWPTPNGQIVETPVFSYNEVAGSLTVTVKVKNVGDASFINPFYVTVYNNIGNTTHYIHEYQNEIAIGATATITFTILDYKANWTPFASLVLKINDKGTGTNDQAVCDDSKAEYQYLDPILPDNIVDADCYIKPPAQDWSIAYTRSAASNISTYQVPIVGDIDDDGIVEIICGANPSTGTSVAERNAKTIYI
ncbi:MAG: VCBS repeat-containing protein [Prevotella sp.]|jgi:hypothetical protein|nr:VCBS repeat-containing protein [Prevotella sp.]